MTGTVCSEIRFATAGNLRRVGVAPILSHVSPRVTSDMAFSVLSRGQGKARAIVPVALIFLRLGPLRPGVHLYGGFKFRPLASPRHPSSRRPSSRGPPSGRHGQAVSLRQAVCLHSFRLHVAHLHIAIYFFAQTHCFCIRLRCQQRCV